MNAATRMRLRITGFALVVAALISNWVVDRKAAPPPAPTRALVVNGPLSAPTHEPAAPGSLLSCGRTPTTTLPGSAPTPLAANCGAGSQ